MDFKQILTTLPTVDHLSGLDIVDVNQQVIHHIPAIEGKLGSLRVYYALALAFSGQLDRTSAEKGLALFAEHTLDAKANIGKHPNIDFLFNVIDKSLNYRLIAVEK
ncbi:DUF2322 family protein [Conservatibacter flavescens]|uniref:DUF2322 domain-containing protein n=1 Tax=Conservatibacter flavescens TaxID=28161 RepID=A0A2M8S4V8_9PAST|nr:DUF2322 family protein [Conservatibacter flavescens]PJG86175.1 DUF2322 domain-containing protein [Conservatibacter flavescens]